MSGLTTFREVDCRDGSRFVNRVGVTTSRYVTEKNRVQFDLNSCPVTAIRDFANTYFSGLGAQFAITQSEDWQPIENLNTAPLPDVVLKIKIPGAQARLAVMALFQKNQIITAQYSNIAPLLRELDECLFYISQLSGEISVAQREIIESFVGPYLPVLTHNMSSPHLQGALKQATHIIKPVGELTPRVFADSISWRKMRPDFQRPASESNPETAIINPSLDKTTQSNLIEALYMIGRVLAGKAHLENALIQLGSALPNLETQNRVIMELLI